MPHPCSHTIYCRLPRNSTWLRRASFAEIARRLKAASRFRAGALQCPGAQASEICSHRREDYTYHTLRFLHTRALLKPCPPFDKWRGYKGGAGDGEPLTSAHCAHFHLRESSSFGWHYCGSRSWCHELRLTLLAWVADIQSRLYSGFGVWLPGLPNARQIETACGIEVKWDFVILLLARFVRHQHSLRLFRLVHARSRLILEFQQIRKPSTVVHRMDW